jgi:predicted metal-dependent HD superfamily phosphohydrolase
MFRRNGEERFAAALEAAGGDPGGAQELHALLTARYGERHRAYHNLSHIESCLALLDRWRGLAACPAEVELALWFHDAVYDPRRSDNEHESSELANQSLSRAGVPVSTRARVVQLILATARHEPAGDDQALLLSIDLAILGAEPAEYDAFERAIRAEYSHVPESAYVQGRRAVLARFLARPVIYPCRPVAELLEAPARRNLGRALERLAEADSQGRGPS